MQITAQSLNRKLRHDHYSSPIPRKNPFGSLRSALNRIHDLLMLLLFVPGDRRRLKLVTGCRLPNHVGGLRVMRQRRPVSFPAARAFIEFIRAATEQAAGHRFRGLGVRILVAALIPNRFGELLTDAGSVNPPPQGLAVVDQTQLRIFGSRALRFLKPIQKTHKLLDAPLA